MSKRYIPDRHLGICISFDNQIEYIQTNVSLIDPRKPESANNRNLKVILSRIDDVRKLIHEWEPTTSRLKSLRIATLTRLDGCIGLINGQIETNKIHAVHGIMQEIKKIRDDFTGF